MKAAYGAEMPFLEFSTIFIVDVDDFFVDALDEILSTPSTFWLSRISKSLPGIP